MSNDTRSPLLCHLLSPAEPLVTMTDCRIATRRLSAVAVCVVALASIGGSGRVSAQSKSEVWQSIGPNLPTEFDSATYDLAVDPQTPTTVYVGSRAGVYKTIDAGAHWFAANTGLPGDGHPIVDSLVMDPQNPSTLYAGITVRTIFEPRAFGVFKTTDGGTTWTAATEGLGSRYTFELAIDPQTPSTVYAIAGGPVYSCCTGLLYKTTDGGASWAVLNDFQTNVILVDPQTPSTLYASGGSGVRKSTDGGATWSDASTGLNQFPTALEADPFTPGVVYAGTNSSGMYKTTNGGASWTQINNGLTDPNIRSVTVNPVSPGYVYVGTSGGAVFKTSDGGSSWSMAANGLGTTWVRDLAVNPQTPETVYASTSERGVYKTTDAGGTWVAANSGLSNAQVYSLAIAGSHPARLYAGTFKGVMSTSVEGTSQWSSPKVGAIIRALVADPQNPSILYAWNDNSADLNIGFLYKTTDGGANWTATSFAVSGGLAIDPLTPSILYASTRPPGGTAGVYKTTDGGTSWSLTGLHQTTSALAVDPGTPTTVYAGNINGVFKTTDGGATWTLNGDLASLSVLALAVDPQTTSHVLAATRGGVLYRSDDGGEHWGAAAGLPGVDVFAIAIDPQSPSMVYAGTYGAGVFRSTDGAWNWSALNDGLSQRFVRSLVINPSTGVVYAGTDGSGVFALTPTMTPSPYYELSIERPGHGSGTVETTDGFLYCGQHCSDLYSATTEVTLRFTEASDSFFVGWQGCDVVNEDGTCFVTMDRARTVIAEFALRN